MIGILIVLMVLEKTEYNEDDLNFQYKYLYQMVYDVAIFTDRKISILKKHALILSDVMPQLCNIKEEYYHEYDMKEVIKIINNGLARTIELYDELIHKADDTDKDLPNLVENLQDACKLFTTEVERPADSGWGFVANNSLSFGSIYQSANSKEPKSLTSTLFTIFYLNFVCHNSIGDVCLMKLCIEALCHPNIIRCNIVNDYKKTNFLYNQLVKLLKMYLPLSRYTRPSMTVLVFFPHFSY